MANLKNVAVTCPSRSISRHFDVPALRVGMVKTPCRPPHFREHEPFCRYAERAGDDHSDLDNLFHQRLDASGPGIKDIEDGGVLATAYAAHAGILITDNLKDFVGQDAETYRTSHVQAPDGKTRTLLCHSCQTRRKRTRNRAPGRFHILD